MAHFTQKRLILFSAHIYASHCLQFHHFGTFLKDRSSKQERRQLGRTSLKKVFPASSLTSSSSSMLPSSSSSSSSSALSSSLHLQILYSSSLFPFSTKTARK